jgi:multimeric flavodoxin WrbA
MKKVVVISTSFRQGSNSHAMAEQFARGAEAAGHVSQRGKKII